MFINTILEHSHTQISTDMYGCNAGDLGSILGLGRSPREGNGNPLQDSGLYSPWGHKELDMTERLSLSLWPLLCYSGGAEEWQQGLYSHRL